MWDVVFVILGMVMVVLIIGVICGVSNLDIGLILVWVILMMLFVVLVLFVFIVLKMINV